MLTGYLKFLNSNPFEEDYIIKPEQKTQPSAFLVRKGIGTCRFGIL